MVQPAIDHLSLARAFTERHLAARRLANSNHEPVPLRRPSPVLRFVLDGADHRPVAGSREPCAFCQIRGDLGCAHQRPFAIEEQPREPGSTIISRRTFSPWEDGRILELKAAGLSDNAVGRELNRYGSAIGTRFLLLKQGSPLDA